MQVNLIPRTLCRLQPRLATRSISFTPALSVKRWREERGLPVNKNAEGVLTDAPDYTFLDGRPTPLLQKQKVRMERQQGYAQRIVQMCSELDFAKRRYRDMQAAEQQEREKIRQNWLKPKGRELTKKT